MLQTKRGAVPSENRTPNCACNSNSDIPQSPSNDNGEGAVRGFSPAILAGLRAVPLNWNAGCAPALPQPEPKPVFRVEMGVLREGPAPRVELPSDTYILRDQQLGYLVDHASVIVLRLNGSAFVHLRCVEHVRENDGQVVTIIRRRPWGWPDLDLEFLNPQSAGVERYADKVLAFIRAKALARCEDRHQQRCLREVERLLRLQERSK